MRRNCPHCGVDQFVVDDKLTAGLVFLKCHHCAALSAVQGKAAQNLVAAAEKKLRTSAPQLEVQLSAAPNFPKVPEFLKEKAEHQEEKSEPQIFETEAPSAAPQPLLLEEELPSASGRTVLNRVRLYALPIALAVVCFSSGGYLIRSAKSLRDGIAFFPMPASAPVVASDLAPNSELADSTAPVSSREIQRAPASVAANAQPQSPQAPVAIAEPKPVQPVVAAASNSHPANPERKVEVLAQNAVLRAGPGTHYNKVGTARAELQLIVKGSFDEWIEVRTGRGLKSAWIRRDLVKPIAQVAQVAQSPQGPRMEIQP